MFKHFLRVLCIVVGLAGCSIYKIDSRNSTLDFYPPKSSVEQVVYLNKIEKPYEVIGIVTATTDRTRPLPEIIDKMRQEAAILGGDAITEIRSDAYEVACPQEKKHLFKGNNILVHYSAKVIIFK